MAVTPGGHVQVAWYNADAEDLMLGSYPEKLGAFAVPVPSTPAPQGTGGPSGPALKCPKGTVEILAPPGANGAGFQTTKVTAPSGSFRLCFNNDDPPNTHNVEIFKSASDASSGAKPLAGDQPFTGPKLDVFPVSGLAPGDYYFHCVVHPTTMTGTLTVK
jgi:plastocyanin